MNFHVAALVTVVMVTLWLAQIYLSLAQWWDAKYGEDVEDGYTILTADAGKNISLWSPPDRGSDGDTSGVRGNNSQISKSLGGWCTACNGSSPSGEKGYKKQCEESCGGSAAQRGLAAGQIVPKGFQKVTKGSPPASVAVTTADDCRVLCEQNKGKGPEDDCSAWEFQPAVGGDGQGGVGSTCFLYVLANYPPNIGSTDGNDSTKIAWSTYGLRRTELVRQVAVSVFSIAPLVILSVAYHNYYYGAADLGALSVAVPIAAAVALFAFLGLVGFRDTYPDLPRGQCFGGAGNQQCFANAATGGLNSGVCYGKCCGATVSCRVEDSLEQVGKYIYNTCTWPNVACRDGACSSDPTCGDHGGVATDYCESGGVPVADGADYNGTKKTDQACYAVNTLQNSGWLSGSTSGTTLGGSCDAAKKSLSCPLPFTPAQYQGESNPKPSPKATSDTGLTVLPPGLSDPGARLTPAGKSPITSFEMTQNLQNFLAQSPTDPKKPVWGCGMATDHSLNRDVLFLAGGTPNYMTCNVNQ